MVQKSFACGLTEGAWGFSLTKFGREIWRPGLLPFFCYRPYV
jgi:hypothetical protein